MAAGYVQFLGRLDRLKIVPRSAYGVFELLGALHIPVGKFDQLAKPPFLWMAAANEDKQLTDVVLANGQQRCFVHTWFYDGDYCVPETATNTERILQFAGAADRHHDGRHQSFDHARCPRHPIAERVLIMR
jgi:hypothetical protein